MQQIRFRDTLHADKDPLALQAVTDIQPMQPDALAIWGSKKAL